MGSDWEHKEDEYLYRVSVSGTIGDNGKFKQLRIVNEDGSSTRIGKGDVDAMRFIETVLEDGELIRRNRDVDFSKDVESMRMMTDSRTKDQSIPFSEWLDFHCRDGWEVLKMWHIKSVKGWPSISGERVVFRRRKIE